MEFSNTGQRLDRFYKMTPGSDMKILKAWNENPRSVDAAKDLIVAVIDLPNLGGSAIIKEQGYDVECIMEFEGE